MAQLADNRRGLAALGGKARALGGVLLCALCAVAGYAIRYGFVEPEALGAACERTAPWWCPIRTGFIMFTEWRGFGWLAAALAAAALAGLLADRPALTRRCAAAALVAGGLGMILYNAGLAIPAAVIAALCLMRSR